MFTTEPMGRQVLEVENLEVQTAEGHCHRVEEMSLGSLADTIGPGKLFGEVCFRSIEGKERRPASAKCLEETSCVVIRKQVFTKAMKDEQKRCDEERMAFLEAHLPGMREALSSEKSSPKGKAAISFKQALCYDVTTTTVAQGICRFVPEIRQGSFLQGPRVLETKRASRGHHLHRREGDCGVFALGVHGASSVHPEPTRFSPRTLHKTCLE